MKQTDTSKEPSDDDLELKKTWKPLGYLLCCKVPQLKTSLMAMLLSVSYCSKVPQLKTSLMAMLLSVSTAVSLSSLRTHEFIAKQQAAFLVEKKANLKGEAVVIGNFAQKYSFVIQDAVQGFHWNNEQYPKLLEFLTVSIKNLRKVYYFTDGASSKYKNRKKFGLPHAGF
eukprot:Em0022g344a